MGLNIGKEWIGLRWDIRKWRVDSSGELIMKYIYDLKGNLIVDLRGREGDSNSGLDLDLGLLGLT